MELVDFEADNKIRRLGKNLPFKSKYARGQYIGIFKLNATGSGQLKEFYSYYKCRHNSPDGFSYKKAWISDLFAEMIKLGIDITAAMIESGWFEVNTFDDYQALLKIQSLKESKYHPYGNHYMIDFVYI